MNLSDTEILYLVKSCTLLHDIGKISPFHYKDHTARGINVISGLTQLTINNENIEELTIPKVIELHHQRKFHKESKSIYHNNSRLFKIAPALIIGDLSASRADKAGKETFIKKQQMVSSSHPIRGEVKPIDQKTLDIYELSIRNNLQSLNDNYKTVEDFFEKLTDIFTRNLDIIKALRDVPSDTRFPINDHSLWSHIKMTSLLGSIYACWRMLYPDDCEEFPLSITSATLYFNTNNLIKTSLRLNDASGRCELVYQIVKNLLEHLLSLKIPIRNSTGNQVDYPLSYDNIIFPDITYLVTHHEILKGLSFLELIIPSVALNNQENENHFVNLLKEQIDATFREISSLGNMPSTEYLHSLVQPSLKILQKEIQVQPKKAFREIGNNLGRFFYNFIQTSIQSETKKPVFGIPFPPQDGVLCMSCGINKGHVSKHRFDIACDDCKKVRKLGQGIWIDDIADKSNKVAIITLNGCDTRLWLAGKKTISLKNVISLDNLSTINRSWNLSRMNEISMLIQDAIIQCSDKLNQIISERAHEHKLHIEYEGILQQEIDDDFILGNATFDGLSFGVFAIISNSHVKGGIIGVDQENLNKILSKLQGDSQIVVQTRTFELVIHQVSIKEISKGKNLVCLTKSGDYLKCIIPGNLASIVCKEIGRIYSDCTGLPSRIQCIVMRHTTPISTLEEVFV